MTTELEARVPEMNELVKWQGYSIEAERMAQSLAITCDEEDQMAVGSLSQIKQFQKETENARKAHVDPFNTLVKRVNGMFKPIAESLERAENVIKEKMKFYRIEKEKVRQREEAKQLEEYRAKIAAEVKKPEAEQRIVAPPPVILPAATTTRGGEGSASAKEFWNYEVMDIAALYAARPDLVTLEGKRRDILAAVKTNQTIPGLRIYKDMEIAAR